MRIRPAAPQDVEAIARVHIDSWRAAYRGLMPDAVLDRLDYAESAERWTGRVADKELVALVAETDGTDGSDAGRIVGFALGGHERSGDPVYTAELYAIYLDPRHLRRGTGTLLVRALAQALCDRGHRSLLVWVLSANPARHFYTALGAEWVRAATLTIGGAELPEEAYGWRDLRQIAG